VRGHSFIGWRAVFSVRNIQSVGIFSTKHSVGRTIQSAKFRKYEYSSTQYSVGRNIQHKIRSQ
jgi:hypothetical protein